MVSDYQVNRRSFLGLATAVVVLLLGPPSWSRYAREGYGDVYGDVYGWRPMKEVRK